MTYVDGEQRSPGPERAENLDIHEIFQGYAEACLMRGVHVYDDTGENGSIFTVRDLLPLTTKGVESVSYIPPYTYGNDKRGSELHIVLADPEIMRVVTLVADENGLVKEPELTCTSKLVKQAQVATLKAIATDSSRDGEIAAALEAKSRGEVNVPTDPTLAEIAERLTFMEDGLSPGLSDMLTVRDALGSLQDWFNTRSRGSIS